jgi:hypothetical protein
MATPTLKTTYSLDLETVRTLDALAQRWNVSKSEALRRAIRAAAGGVMPGAHDALRALDALQKSLRLTPATALAWERRTRVERRASSQRLLKRSR